MTDPTLKYFGAVIPLGNTSEILDSKAWQIFLNFCKSLGLTNFGNISYYAVVQAWAEGVEPPPAVPPFTIPPVVPPTPPPIVPWYELLQEPLPGAPKAKIFAVKDHRSMSATVPVYKSSAADQPPSFLDIDTRTKKPGESVEVWHAVVPGSRWICTFDGPQVGIAGLVLWMWAEDVARDKPV